MVSISNSSGGVMIQTEMLAEELTWTDPTCPVARTLDLIGDRWSLLIVRDAMDGARSFTEFQQRTGIARNILTDRLRRLVERGIIDRQAAASGRRQQYSLTNAGRDLFTVIVALRQWGERHAFAADETHSVMVDELGLPLTRLQPTDSNGNVADAGTTSVRKDRLFRAGAMLTRLDLERGYDGIVVGAYARHDALRLQGQSLVQDVVVATPPGRGRLVDVNFRETCPGEQVP